METSNLLSLLEQLDDDIDDLEESLAPLLEKSLAAAVSKLPLLDKAKLYVLVTYAIESILFSYLRINGVKAREHPVFTELTRVKQYFDKIKAAESPATRTHTLNKVAAGRFIKAGLDGNDKWDLVRAEQQAKERARAHIKFEELSKQIEKRKVEVVEELGDDPDSDSSSSASSSSASSSDSSKQQKSAPAPKKRRKLDQPTNHSSTTNSSSTSEDPSSTTTRTDTDKDRRGKSKRPARKERKRGRTAKAEAAAS